MTKEEFLKQLDKAFSGLPKQEKEELLQYYAEYLDQASIEGDNLSAAIDEIGTPKQIAQAYLEENSPELLEQKAFRSLERKGFGKRFIKKFSYIVLFIILAMLSLIGTFSIVFFMIDIFFFKQWIAFQTFALITALGVVYLSLIGIKQLLKLHTASKGRFL